jgi:hypothetical protein
MHSGIFIFIFFSQGVSWPTAGDIRAESRVLHVGVTASTFLYRTVFNRPRTVFEQLDGTGRCQTITDARKTVTATFTHMKSAHSTVTVNHSLS